jgi:hypothetical protein
MHRWIHQRLAEWAALPADSLPADPIARQRLLMTIYQMHVPLKRLSFRLGFLRGLDLIDDSHWLDRRPSGLWRQAIAAS